MDNLTGVYYELQPDTDGNLNVVFTDAFQSLPEEGYNPVEIDFYGGYSLIPMFK